MFMHQGTGATLSFVTPYIAVKYEFSPEQLLEPFSVLRVHGMSFTFIESTGLGNQDRDLASIFAEGQVT